MIFVAVAQVPKGRGSMAALRLVVMVRKPWKLRVAVGFNYRVVKGGVPRGGGSLIFPNVP